MKKALFLRLWAFVDDQGGATAIEYALIGSLLSIAIIGSVVALNGSMVELFEHIRSYIQPALEGGD
jgi:pilus assembly protein Flp/PilA